MPKVMFLQAKMRWSLWFTGVGGGLKLCSSGMFQTYFAGPRKYWLFVSEGKIDERFREQYERLLEIRNQLDRLSVTQAWSLRETDLFGYQRKLDRIDEARINGNFVDAEGQPADLHAQRVILCIPFVRWHFANSYSDAALPHSSQLCIHLCAIDFIGACIRSSTSSL